MFETVAQPVMTEQTTQRQCLTLLNSCHSWAVCYTSHQVRAGHAAGNAIRFTRALSDNGFSASSHLQEYTSFDSTCCFMTSL